MRVAGVAPLLLLLATCQVDKLTNSPPPIARLMLAPVQVQDSAPVGSMAATDDSLTVANGGPGTLSWVAHLASGGSWVAFVGPNSGTAPATLRIAFNPAGLGMGVYRDTVIVDAQNAANSPGRVPVEFTVQPCVPTALVVNAPAFTDSLTTADCTAPHRSTSFARLYSFTGAAGDSVSISMSSTAVDAFIVLDTSSNNAAPALATNDSCSGGADACLRYQLLPVAGTYRIEAASAGAGQTGRYTLSVTRPRAPVAVQLLAQLRSDSVTPIAIGDTTGERSIVLRGLLSDPDVGDSLRLQVELQPVGIAFTGTPTATGNRVANGQTAFVAANGLTNNTTYHWQARALDQTGRAGPWISFGGNPESATDFSTSIPVPPNVPTTLGQFQSDAKTAIPVGGTATGRSVIFKATVTDSNPGDQLRLDVEAEPLGSAFQNSPSGSGAPITNGGIATATVAGLSDNTAYHWQARAVDQTGRAGPWGSFGNNAETATDFRVAVAVTQLAFTAQPANTVAGIAISPAVQVTAQDALGNTVTSFAGNVTISISNNAGSGTLSGTLTVAAVNGVASFSTLSIDKVGSGYTLSAATTGLTTTSGPFAITPAAAKQLSFTVQPTDVPAGSPITPAVQVMARDTFGNIATGFTGNVSVAIGNNSGGGTLTGATTQAAVAGVATFGTLSIDKSGTGYTLTASATSLATATSGGFAVTPAAATRLVFTIQPVSATAGSAIAPAVQVTAEDNLGNTVTTFTGTVIVAIGNNPGGGTLSGTASRAAVSGVATFPGLSVDKAGTGYTLSASATGTAAAASAAFNITPASAAQLVFTVQPTATTAGTAITPAVQVTARDALGNTATGFTGNVTVAIGANPGGGTPSGTLTVAATAGIATFANLSIDKSGSGYTLTAAGTGVTGSASAAFDIRPGAATRLAFTAEPVNGTATVALAPPVQVTAQDGFGNRDTAYTGTVTVALATNPGGATLSGTTSVAAAAGVATFATLRLDKAGTGYTLTATGTGLTAATSTSFNVVAGTVSASLSTVSATPGVIAASTGAGAATITVTAKDASGNPVPGATVLLAATGTGNALTQPAGPTDATGVATGTLSSPVSEVKTVSATISGVAATQTATVTVTPASVSATHSSLATAPATIVASSGANAATITATAHDGFDNPIPSATVVLAAAGSGVSLTQPASGTNASGVATGSVSASLVGPKILSATINGVAVAQTDTLSVGPAVAAGLAFSVQPTNSTAGSTITPAVQVTALDQFGNTATGFTASVTVALGANPGGGSLTGTLTRNAVAGVATFADLSVNKAGSGYTLTAAASGLPVVPSAAFNVVAGTGTQLVFTVQPTSDTARAILSPAIQVTAEDAIGNPITSFTGNVTVALGANPGGGTLAGTTTVPAVNGVATFSTLSLAKSGTGYTLIASTTTAGYNTPSSAPFNIAPGATSKLVFTVQPANTVAGSAITPAVQVAAHDASDNVAPAFTGNVSMAIGTNPGTGVLSGTVTKTAVAGVASFGDLSINKAGVGYTLSAAASGVASGTSSAFNIVAGAAAALAVTRQPPATGQSGAVLTVQPQVQLRDANGNNVAQGNVTITAAIATGSTGATLAGSTAVTGTNGQATFSGLAITGPAGSYRVAFTSGTLQPDTSTVIALSAGAAAQLALTTQPSAAVANNVVFAQQPVVQLLDAAGNPVSQSGVVVTAALATGNPTLGGTLTTTTNAGGAAVFTNLEITGLVGSRTLSFSATGLTAVTSTAVVVSAGAATQIAVNAGNNQAATAGTAVGTPPSVIVRDVSGNVVAGVAVTFAVPDASNGSLTGPSPTTNAGGVATVGSWTLSAMAKPDTMTATSTGLSGSPVTFVDTAKVGAATTLAKFSGDNLTGQVGTTLSTPHVVLVSDANGNPVPNVTISWAAAAGGGSVNPTSSVTGADGKASTTRTLGPLPGTQTTTASASGLATVTFSITAQVGGATQMVFADSSVRRDTVGQTIPAALAVKVMDALNNPVQGITISWAVLNGGGSVNPVSSVTNSSGIATTSWTLGTAMGPTDSTQFVQASGVASPLTFTAYTVPGAVNASQTTVTASSPITASTGSSASNITVIARDQYGNVIKGRTVTLVATGTANTLTNPAAPTDVNGTATGTLSSTKAETKVITATVGGVAIAQQPSVVVNPDVAANLNFVGQPTGAVAGTTIAPPVTVEIRDQFNNRVTTATNGVGLVIGTNPSGGTLTGGGTVSAASGVATFSALSIDKAGSGYTLSALSTGLTSATSAAFNISTAGVSGSHSTVAATSPITAGGGPSTITVTALDQFNNPVQGATVALAATGSGNTLTQPVGTTNASGVVTGTLASTVAESKSVSATISGVAVTQTATLVVNPGGAATLAFTQQPSSAVAGTAISPTIQVTARDANGNVATAFTGAVSLTLGNNAGGGTLSGGGPVTAVNGVASFSNVSIDKVGTGYTLTASATGPTAVTSSTFNIAPAAATGLAFTVQPASAVAGSAIAPAVQVTARDDFGNTATGFTGTVSIAIGANPGGGTLSGTVSKAAAAGVVSFADLAINKTGNGYTLSATAIGVGGATSGAFNITPAGATQLVFSQQPSNVVAGVAISPAVTVTALDANNNVATGFTGSVSLVIGTNPGGAILSGGGPVTAANGVATFAGVSLNKVGTSYTLTAASSGLAGAGSTTFNVAPAAASILVFTVQPSNVIAGTAITPAVQVTARDQFGNTATEFAGTVGMAIGTNPSAGTLTGTVTQTATGGVATFGDLSLDKAGSGYTLATSSGGLTGATSATFNVGPAPAKQLAFTVQPANAVSGTAIAPPVQVTARDQFGNTDTTYAGNVTLAIVTNPGGGTLSGATAVAAAHGVATFSTLSIDKVGSGYQLGASATSLTGATSTAFNITPAAATQLVFGQQPTDATAGVAISPAITVSALDGSGNAATGFTGNVTIAIANNAGGGTLSGTATVAAVAGVATFSNLSINKAGTGYTLAATASGLTGATSSGFTINAAAASQLAFTVQPTTEVAGVSITPAVQVSARDAFGNTVPGFTSTVTVAIGTNPGAGTLSGTTSVAAVSGVATFADLSINKSGTGYTVTASAAGVGGTTSSAFNITPAAAAQLVFTRQPPANTAAGANMTPGPRVTAEDQFGNVVTSFTGAITVAIGTNPGGGTLSGTTTVTAVNGVATFTTLKINKSGTGYTLVATSDALTPGTSAPFNITAASATQVMFVQQPSNTTAGASISPAVTVAAQDVNGNVVTTFTGNVTVALAANPGGGTLSGTLTQAASAGVATFSNLSINKASVGYTLAASSGTLVKDTSTVFTVTADGVSASLSTLTAGSPISASSGTSQSTITATARDQFGNPIQGMSVTLVASGTGNTLTPPAGPTDVNGVATGTLSSTVAESKTVSATIGAVAITQTATVVVSAAAPTAATVNAGNGESATVNTAVTTSPSVILRDQFNNPVPGVAVTFAVTGGGGTVNPTTPVTTGPDGIAAASSWTLGATAGPNTLTATASGSGISGNPVTFTATGTAGAATQIAVSGGNGQSATVNTPVGTPPSVIVRDASNNPVAGVSVTFAVASGGGTVNPTTAVTSGANGIASATSWTLGTVAGGNTLTATVSGAGISGNPVTFTATSTPGTATALVFTAQPGNGTAGATLTPPTQVTARDQFGNTATSFAAGVTLTIGTNPGGGTLTGGGPLTAVSGVATFSSLSIDKAGVGYTLVASGGSLTSGPTAAFTITAGGASASQSTVVATSPITAGAGTSTITVTARDANGNPIQGVPVTLAATGTGNTLTQPVGTTNASGVATGALSSTVAEVKTVSATINSVAITQTASVTVNPGAVSAAQSTVAATSPITAGSGTSTIMVTAKDANGNVIPGATVTLAATGTGNTLTQPAAVTDANGQATGTLTSTKAEVKTISATINSVAITQTATVTVNAGSPSAAQSTVSATSPITAGSGTSTITVIVKDASGNPIQGATVTLAASSTTGNTLTQPVGTTDVNGQITGSLSSTKAETKVITATVNTSVTVTQTATVVVNPGAPSAAQSTVAATSPITAGSGSSTITVTAKDANGNLIQGATVVLAASGTGNTLTQPAGGTSASGVATGTLSSTVAESKTVSATISGVAVTQTATVVVNAAGASSIAVNAGNGQSATVSTPVPTAPSVIVRDAFNNPVTGVVVTFAVATGGGTVSPTTAVLTGTNGIASVTSWTLGPNAGSNTLTATSGSLAGSPVTFTATGTAGAATRIAISAGNNQSAIAGTIVATAPSVLVQDAHGNPVAGVAVTFAVASGGGTVSPTTAVTTVSNGIAQVTSWTLGTTAGTNTLTATSTGLAGSPLTFTATGTAGPPATMVKSSGDNLTGQVATQLQTPHVVLVSDANGNPVSGVTVTWAAASGGGSVNPATSTTDANGHAQTFRTLGVSIGTQTTTATATIGGTATTVTFTITATAAGASQMTVAGGDGQTGTVGTTLPTQLSVRVVDQFNNPVAGVTVTWTPANGSGSVNPTTSASNGSGIAATSWTLGTGAGTQTVQATGAGSPVSFTATATAGAATQIALSAGNNQSATVGTSVTTAPAVLVQDAHGNPVGGVAVTFAVASGGGTVNPTTPVTSGVNGIAQVTSWTLGTTAGQNTLTAMATGLTGSPVTFTATGTAGAATQIALNAGNNQSATVGTAVATAPSVIVKDAANNPVAGVSVTFAAASGGGTVSPTTPVPTGANGVAQVTSWTLGTTAGQNTLTATATGLTGSPVTFTATGTPGTATALVFTVQPGNGTAGAALTPPTQVTAHDQFGNTATGFAGAVTLAIGTNPASGTLTGGGPVTAVNGVATFSTLSIDKAGNGYTLLAASGTLSSGPSASFNITAGGVSASQSTVVATSPITAGSGTSTVTVTARDANGNPIQGLPVTLAASGTGNTVTQPVGTTNASGVATGTLSSTVAEVKTVSATVNAVAITQTASVTVNPGAVSAAQSTVAATSPITAGSGTSTITVTARDASGNPIQGATVTLAATPTAGNTLTQPVGTTDANGVATGTLSSTVAGSKTVSATINSVAITQTATVVVNPGAVSAGQSTVTATSPIAAGTGTSTITVTAKDGFGNPIPGAAVVLAASGTGNTLTQPSGPTGTDGVATGTMSSLVAESKTVSATINSVAVSQTATVVVQASTVSGTQSSLTATTPITASSGSSQSTITVTARDALGNPVAGASVVLAATGTGNTLTQPATTTSASGVATGTLSSTVAEPKTVSATINGVAVTQTATVVVNAATASTVAVNAGNGQSATVGTAVPTAPSVIVRDQFTNPVAGVAVTFAVASGGGVVNPTTPVTTGANGIAQVTSWTLGTTAGTNTLTATATGLTGSPVTFTATGTAGAATQIALNGGNNQSATVGTAVATAPSVIVKDASNNPVGGVAVTFAVASGGGVVNPTTPVTTGANGIAQVTSWVLGTTAGQNTLTATSGSLSGSPVTFTATGTAGAANLIALNAGNNQSATVGTAVSTAPSVIVKDASNNPVAGVAVTFAVASGGGSVTGATQTTDASGVATVGSWTLGNTAGSNTLTATSGSLSGSPVTFTATGTVGAATQLAINGGNNQAATVGTAVPTAPSVLVQDAHGNPVAGVAVTFAVGSGGGTVNPTTAVTTGSNGIAQVTSWTLGTTAGTNTLTATATGLNGSPVTFTATGTAGAATQIAIDGGNNQSATVGTAVATVPSVIVKDASNNPVGGVAVTFAVASGGGSITGASQTTNASGIAMVGSWTLGSAAGTNTLTATSGLLNGSPVTFTATGTAGAASSITVNAGNNQSATVGTAVATAPSVIVKDASNNPVAGVAVTFVVASGGGNLTGATQTTDASGIATVGSWTLGNTAGSNTLTATSGSLSGSPLTFTATGTAGAATQIVINAGNNQSATVGTQVSVPPSVIVRDKFSNPVGGVEVTFAVASGGGTVNPTTPVTTGTNGIAQVASWTVGATVGSNTLTATSTGLSGSPVTFTATGTAGAASSIAINAGNNQSAAVGTAVAIAPSVIVRDASSNPVPGVAVTFSVTSGGGSATGASQTTDVNGIATVGGWTLGTTVGSNTLAATSGTLTGSPVTFTATGTAGPASSIAVNAGNNQSATVGTAVTTPPSVIVRDASNNPVAGVAVTFAVASGGGSVTGASQTTDVNGIATVGGWTLGTTTGSNTLTATSGTLSGSPVTFTATATTGPASSIAINGGNGQSATVNTAVGTAPSVIVKDQFGNVVAGVSVTFAVASGGGSLTGASQTTDAGGIAVVGSWTLGTAAGSNTLTATSGTLNGSPVTFTATGTAGPASTIAINSGNNQSATVNTAVAIPPSVVVHDQFGNGVAGVAVSFAVASGGGSATGSAATTDAGGIATVGSWTLGTAAGANTLTATSGTLAGSPVTFSATGTPDVASHLVFTVQPATTKSNTPMVPAVVVTAFDQFGNTATGFTGTVTVTITPLTGTPGATLSNGLVSASSGVATFSSLSIDLVGVGYELDANATGVTGVTSTPFDITL